ncbi:hypothetical protein [Frigoriglobus tundricola]|uniref:hypothetical protein n=1 Tax=Frigoriglobus tundricola TaxID=2774151 RepID=UPI00148EE7FD|nr:hypothetical protein [Frigoriglobus tundricola]
MQRPVTSVPYLNLRPLGANMKRRVFFAILLLICTVVAYTLALYLSTPEAKSRKVFRHNLVRNSPNWHTFDLAYSPSPGCGYTATAIWKKGEEAYAFSGLRHPDSIGGTAVSVYSVKDGRIDDTKFLVWYRFTTDRHLSKIEVGEGIESEMDWAKSVAQEFVNAMPDYIE